MCSHVASKVASSSARVVALKADKRFLSAMNCMWFFNMEGALDEKPHWLHL